MSSGNFKGRFAVSSKDAALMTLADQATIPVKDTQVNGDKLQIKSTEHVRRVDAGGAKETKALTAGCYKFCCPSGDCDTTCCMFGGAHVECNNGKANAVCDNG